MPSVLPPSRDLARWLLSRELREHKGPEDLGAAAEAVCKKLDESLSRSIGRAGFRALFARALASARDDHPFLIGVKSGDSGPWLPELDASLAQNDADTVTEGVVGVFTEIIELLNRFVGGLLALRLLQAAWPDLISEATEIGRQRESHE